MKPTTPTTPELSVVIVNWNTAHLMVECLDSVAAETESLATEIIVVDNGSTDGSLELLAEYYPEVIVLPMETNLGYQAACNKGSRAANAPLMLHINTDARLTNGALKAMIDVLNDEPRVGIIAPRLEYGDGTFQRWTAGQLPSLSSLTHSFVLGDRVPGKGVWIDEDRMTAGPVGWVSSACLLVRAETFEAIGGLDEQFFAYMDDVDLCGRAAEQNWTTYYQPRATAVHFMGGSQERTIGVSPTAIKSMALWFRARKGTIPAMAASLIMALGFSIRATAHLLIRRDQPTALAHYKSVRVALAAGASR